MDIKVDDLTGSEIAELLQQHLQRLAQHCLPESIRALDVGGLRKTEITFWSVWSNSELLGYGALKELNAQHGEIKSMHTAALHQRKGVAAKRLKHILEEAKHRKYKRVSLETGSMDAFVPAVLDMLDLGSKSAGHSLIMLKIHIAYL